MLKLHDMQQSVASPEMRRRRRRDSKFSCREITAQNSHLQEGVVDDIACWPPTSTKLPSSYVSEETRTEISTIVELSLPLEGWGIYYPADQCPDGYLEACWGEGPDSGDFDFQFSVYDNERVKGCCPS